MLWGLNRSAEPAAEPVTVQEAKNQARVEHSEEEALWTAWIIAARQHAEDVTHRALINQTWVLSLENFPWFPGQMPAQGFRQYSVLPLPRPKLSSVTSLKYLDTAGVDTTLAGSAYIVDTTNEPGIIVPAYGTVWPVARWQPASVRVTYVAGYGALATAVPEKIKFAIRWLVGWWNEHRELQDTVPAAFEMLLRPFKDTYAWDEAFGGPLTKNVW